MPLLPEGIGLEFIYPSELGPDLRIQITNPMAPNYMEVTINMDPFPAWLTQQWAG